MAVQIGRAFIRERRAALEILVSASHRADPARSMAAEVLRSQSMAVQIEIPAMGKVDAMRLHAASLGQSWVRGLRKASTLYG